MILDTNVVLDWLLFADSDSQPLGAALSAGALRWVATRAMRSELEHVLARGVLDRWSSDNSALWARWDQHCTELPSPNVLVEKLLYRCSDPDDQKFIDLAVALGSCMLLTRDRAILKLARRLGQVDVQVTTPRLWMSATG